MSSYLFTNFDRFTGAVAVAVTVAVGVALLANGEILVMLVELMLVVGDGVLVDEHSGAHLGGFDEHREVPVTPQGRHR
jgi:hypothetical protein